MRNCDNCGKETSNPRFCSKSCSAVKTNKESPKRKITRTCSKCDRLVKSTKHTLCDEHFDLWKLRFKNEYTIGQYREAESVKGKHPSWINSHIRGFARS